MEVLVLQHIKIEDPGYIKDLMLNDGVNLTTIELDEGEKIPDDLNKFDAMFCMGGPMDTWMEDQYPWLIDEKKVIKKFISIIPISAGLDFTTLPPTTSPKSWHPKQKPKKGFFKLITNSFIFFFSSMSHGYLSSIQVSIGPPIQNIVSN